MVVGGGLVTKSCLTLAIPWTIACQAPLSVGFSRQEYWSGLPFPSPGDLPDPGFEPGSPALQADSLPTELQRKIVDQYLNSRSVLNDFFEHLPAKKKHKTVPSNFRSRLVIFLWDIFMKIFSACVLGLMGPRLV